MLLTPDPRPPPPELSGHKLLLGGSRPRAVLWPPSKPSRAVGTQRGDRRLLGSTQASGQGAH